ncbi:MAG: hypothetical protein OHK93_007965 [Ramalina farinacea]|uniref:O-methyltransferase C-terminal domain-containing protein n=1 Tax=Ramalina farinacea TaxID=258253 RepID=A0AA43QNN2_9LECA|nr:hypothetical protein [Ramalina farinacea]
MSEPNLLEALKAANESPSTRLPQDTMARKTLLTELRKLNVELESPMDSIMRYVFQPHQNAMIRTAIDLGLFELVRPREKNGTGAQELAGETGAEQSLIGVCSSLQKNPVSKPDLRAENTSVRVMRVLVTMGIISEFGEQRYAATRISKTWQNPPLRDCSKDLFDESAFSLAQLPTFLKQTHYKNPSDTANGPFHAFNTYMEVQEVLLNDFNAKEEAVLLVDVGGGRGHDLEAFKEAFPHQEGRLIVQDLPDVIDDIRQPVPGVEAMKHNFFTPQPVKGARVHFFHYIFHDWPDQQCHDILQQTAAAMTKGYSRILINDWLLANQGGPMFPATMDINMMCLFASGE